MRLDPATARAIEKILLDECQCCDDYLKLLVTEQNSVVKLQADQVVDFATKRSVMCDKLTSLREKREAIVKNLADGQPTSLSEVLSKQPNSAEKRRLTQLIEKLRSKIKNVELRSRELNHVVDFSLGLVNGSLSLLWSATQPVTKTYNANGGVREMVQPAAPRTGSLLGKV